MLTREEFRRPWEAGAFTTPWLDLGCGNHKRPGAVGMDKQRGNTRPDIVHDLETFPWPIEDEAFAAIIAWHLFEHLKPWLIVEVIDECWRVAQPGGLLYIGMPHPGGYEFYQDPTHIRTWNKGTPLHFDPDYKQYVYYRPKPWKIENNGIYTVAKPSKTALYFVLRKRGL